MWLHTGMKDPLEGAGLKFAREIISDVARCHWRWAHLGELIETEV